MRKNLFGLSPATRELVRELWQERTLRDRLTGDHRTHSANDRTTLPLLFDQIRSNLPSALERELSFVLETACG
ncbi:MAG TPA: hypothetical protein VNY05_35275 [Candidatus Acidoferrales bacterium]|jgi:hypothetical protein|nr:hypothetical protein [Candidatus Acidoferrales bacterium]